jgi:uncharacterized membrane protein YphA (DoxX/SURF4 family)
LEPPDATSLEELFRRTFVLKLVLSLGGWSLATWTTDAFTVTAGAAAMSRRLRTPGLVLLLALQLALIADSLPHTLNHHFLEAVLLLHLALLPPAGRNMTDEGPSAALMIRLTIASVWFFSGVQKLANGRYLDGEMLASELALSSGELGQSLRWLLDTPMRSLAYEAPTDLVCGTIDAPSSVVAALLVLSWAVVAVELFLPTLFFVSRWRYLAAWALVVMSLWTAALTGETSFGVTSSCALLLWLPEHASWTFWVLRGGVIVLAFVV